MPTIYSSTGTSLNVSDPTQLKSFLSNGNWSTSAPVPKSSTPAPTPTPMSATPSPPSPSAANGALGAFAGIPNGNVPAPMPKPSNSDSSPSVPAPMNIAGAALGGAVGMGMFDGPKGAAGVPNAIPAPPSSGGFVTPQKATAAPVQALSAPRVPQASVPAPQAPFGQMTQDQIKAEAQARIDAQRAALAQSVNATKAGLKNTYDYNNQILQDSRALEDQQFKRNNSPFTGQTDYLTAQMLRNRGIQDTAAQKDYAANVAAADQKLNDFNALAPEQQQSIVDDLTRLERQYGLDAGQLTGYVNGQRTLQGQAQDANFTGYYNNAPTMQLQNQLFNQNVAQAGLTGMLNGQQTLPAMMQMAQLTGQLPNGESTLAGKQADLANLSTMAGLTGKLADGAPTFAAQQAQQQNAIARAQALGVVDNPQDAALLGVPVGTTTREMQALMNDMAYKNAELGVRQQANDIAAIRAGNQADLNTARAKYYDAKSQPTQSTNKNELESSYVGNIEQMTPDNRAAFFKNEKANIVKDLGVSGYNALYNQYFNSDGTPVIPGTKRY